MTTVLRLDVVAASAAAPDGSGQLRFRQASTLGIWDNRSTIHYASNDYPGQLRIMHRLVVAVRAQ